MDISNPRELRNAFGRFLTGVTVLTCKDQFGTPRGFTANSFTSVSLDPPLLLVCIDKSAESRHIFEAAEHFAVNILSEQQKDISGIFATKDPDKFDRSDWHDGQFGCPLLDDVVAWFECSQHKKILDAGDHVILIGRVEAFFHQEMTPLGYGHGGYFSPGLEQAAVSATRNSAEIIVGAIVERDGEILLLPGEDGRSLHLPHSGEGGHSGSLRNLRSLLADLGLRVTLGFLYTVYENSETGAQAIYYRGEAHEEEPKRGRFYPADKLPWQRIKDEHVRKMLERYFAELARQRFNIYFGDETGGHIDPAGKA
ncbi:MAG: flavin reductase [Gammaproteobacteria bacterium]|nr:flavin reductase [Gammaproteobacteria bacterium]